MISRSCSLTNREPRILLAVIEEIRRGLHMLDHFIHRAFDMLEHRIDCAFSPANCLLNLFELFQTCEISG